MSFYEGLYTLTSVYSLALETIKVVVVRDAATVSKEELTATILKIVTIADEAVEGTRSALSACDEFARLRIGLGSGPGTGV